MKSFKFLVPVGIAAAALGGSAAKADVKSEVPKPEQAAANPAAKQEFRQKYVQNGEEHALLMQLSDQGVLYAQHESHSSHDSHSSHSSHQSGT